MSASVLHDPVPCLPAVRQRLVTSVAQTHLAVCSIAPRSSDVEQALSWMMEDLSRPGFWQACEQQVQRARGMFARLIGAHVDQVAVLPNASIAAHQAVSRRRWRRRRDVVATPAEFPGIAHTWLNQPAVRMRWTSPPGGVVRTSDYLPHITARTGLVSVPAVTYRDAICLDVPRIARAAHDVGAQVFVDAYQAAGVMPLNVDTLRCDYLVAGTGKYLLGLPGLAFLYVRHPDGPMPALTGWLGRANPHALNATVLDSPSHARRYETGTPCAAAVYAAVAGLSLVGDLDLEQVRRHTQRLIATAARRLNELGEVVRIATPPEAQGAHLALVDPQAEALASWLGDRGVITAPRAGVLRLAVHVYSTDEDIDAVCEAIAAYRRHQPTPGGI
ncbi:aminotransferase class V-fold PLP-dependent enzyme [Micromonospora sp. HUAS LYJ1]|uniref:aminotransferase class V-fold PLP-dependent enzyme n=1 Tax=Micromonospora sp. HUAS LYJ1 TaxID=3061626 RepID=UPI0026740DB7|nr:aminotransferase class V-fold PLP-dependent enzyme [Micromonospora sp. HUAS LYJ1]WKU03490.1 aminotransferase class V-fold PLP-dependent enzyme [Micromonospora sp. HUAS LYJ1]